MKTKILFYCTLRKPILQRDKTNGYCRLWQEKNNRLNCDYLNGKIVCECEVEVDKLETEFYIEEPLYAEYGTYQAVKRICLEQLDIVDYDEDWCDRETLYCNEYYLNEEDEKDNKFLRETCLSGKELQKYFNKVDIGYALHISNLKVFNEPLELSDLLKYTQSCYSDNYITKAPQNMMWVWYKGEKYCLISIRPEWLCKILNGEKTIEVRKKILKGMM